MKIEELRNAAECSREHNFESWRELFNPQTILKLLAVVDAAKELIDYENSGQNDKPYPYIFWDDKFKAIEMAIIGLEK